MDQKNQNHLQPTQTQAFDALSWIKEKSHQIGIRDVHDSALYKLWFDIVALYQYKTATEGALHDSTTLFNGCVESILLNYKTKIVTSPSLPTPPPPVLPQPVIAVRSEISRSPATNAPANPKRVSSPLLSELINKNKVILEAIQTALPTDFSTLCLKLQNFFKRRADWEVVNDEGVMGCLKMIRGLGPRPGFDLTAGCQVFATVMRVLDSESGKKLLSASGRRDTVRRWNEELLKELKIRYGSRVLASSPQNAFPPSNPVSDDMVGEANKLKGTRSGTPLANESSTRLSSDGQLSAEAHPIVYTQSAVSAPSCSASTSFAPSSSSPASFQELLAEDNLPQVHPPQITQQQYSQRLHQAQQHTAQPQARSQESVTHEHQNSVPPTSQGLATHGQQRQQHLVLQGPPSKNVALSTPASSKANQRTLPNGGTPLPSNVQFPSIPIQSPKTPVPIVTPMPTSATPAASRTTETQQNSLPHSLPNQQQHKPNSTPKTQQPKPQQSTRDTPSDGIPAVRSQRGQPSSQKRSVGQQQSIPPAAASVRIPPSPTVPSKPKKHLSFAYNFLRYAVPPRQLIKPSPPKSAHGKGSSVGQTSSGKIVVYYDAEGQPSAKWEEATYSHFKKKDKAEKPSLGNNWHTKQLRWRLKMDEDFNLTEDEVRRLNRSSDAVDFPLTIIATTRSVHQSTPAGSLEQKYPIDERAADWPPDAAADLRIYVNDHIVPIERRVMVPMPNRQSYTVQGKDLSCDVGKFVRKGRNDLRVQWRGVWATHLFAVMIFEGEPTEMALEKARSSIITREESISLAHRLLGIKESRDDNLDDDNDDIVCLTTSFRLSLRCPLSLARIAEPARGRKCKHLSCFDLSTYMDLNRRQPTWKCPHCGDRVAPKDLAIDSYVQEVLGATADRAEVSREVDVFELGRWEETVKEEGNGFAIGGGGGELEDTEENQSLSLKQQERLRKWNQEKQKRGWEYENVEDEFGRSVRRRKLDNSGTWTAGRSTAKPSSSATKPVVIVLDSDSE